MGFHYFMGMGRNSKIRKKLMPMQIMISVGMNRRDIVDSVGMYNDSAPMKIVFNV